MGARRAADAINSRRIKSNKTDTFALPEMLRTGWFSPVHAKAIDSHKIKTLLGARVMRLPWRVGAKRFAAAAYQATQVDPLMHAGLAARREASASIDTQVAKRDDGLRSWRAATRPLAQSWRTGTLPFCGQYMAA